ncbi:MAG: hypothetical protein ACD_15C00137G0008 [uncultured bacterium]|nr:MAG: hypothetical protein ACD_15C00137G0008 [uncultured bacterium]
MQKNSQKKASIDLSLRKTQAFKKVRACFESLENNPIFIEDIKKIRKKLLIPNGGFGAPLSKEEDEEAYNQTIFFSSTDGESYFYKEMERITIKYDLAVFGDVLIYYIFYNSIEPFINYGSANIARVIDLKEAFSNNHGLERLKNLHQELPVAILINPYMSQRDLIDYIRVIHKEWIAPIQKAYQKIETPVGKARRKSSFVKKRNDFVFQNRDMDPKKLVSLINKNFHQILDYTYIQRIIRTEVSKRK